MALVWPESRALPNEQQQQQQHQQSQYHRMVGEQRKMTRDLSFIPFLCSTRQVLPIPKISLEFSPFLTHPILFSATIFQKLLYTYLVIYLITCIIYYTIHCDEIELSSTSYYLFNGSASIIWE